MASGTKGRKSPTWIGPRVSLEERFLLKVDKTPNDRGCWVWTAYKTPAGYGMFQVGRKARIAHRVAYELWVGPIPDGLTIDHLCRNRACVNPRHMEPVTQRVNTLRGTSFAVVNAAKTHCLRGHELDEENVYVKKDGGRQCRLCMVLSRERYLAKPESQAKLGAYKASPRFRELARERDKRYRAKHPERARELGRLRQAEYAARKRAASS